MKGFIYKIVNTVNGKIYIGQTKVSVETRWKEHLRHAAYGDQVINRAMKKYGNSNFYIETIEECDLESIDEREKYFIKYFNSTNKSIGYNVSIGGKTPLFERAPLDEDIIVDLYVNKEYTLARISTIYNVSRYIITTTLINKGVKIRDRHDSASRYNKIPKEVLIEALKGRSLPKAAEYANIPYSTFRNACIYHNIEYNSPKSIRQIQ